MGKSYRLHVPPNVPVSAFWSLTLYDTATRSMIQNSGNDSARSGNDNLKANTDGSVDYRSLGRKTFQFHWLVREDGMHKQML